jgi:DNA-binding transcriptional ArsR family regulator
VQVTACMLPEHVALHKPLLVRRERRTVGKKTIEVEDQMSRLFAALADPTRRAIVHRLTSGEATISELARPFEMSQQAVSLHVRVLEDAGLVSRRRIAQTRPCRLEPQQLQLAEDWIMRQRDLWTARHDRLEQHLANLADRERQGADGE